MSNCRMRSQRHVVTLEVSCILYAQGEPKHEFSEDMVKSFCLTP
jgi:hypothetical protein